MEIRGYRLAIFQYAPTGGFIWLMQDKIKKAWYEDQLLLQEDNLEGCIIKVHLEYSEEFSDFHSYYCIEIEISIMFYLLESKSLYQVWVTKINLFFTLENSKNP